MIRRHLVTWAVGLGLFSTAGSAALAEKIAFTGNVETDMVKTPTNGVYVVPGNGLNSVAQSTWMTKEGLINGWGEKDVRFSYNKATDTLQVGVNFFGVAGDVDGNGDPGVADPRTTAAGGLDLAHMGGRKSITVGFAGDAPGSKVLGTPVLVAGIPADKTSAGPGLDGFSVAKYVPSNMGMAFNYGANMPSQQGTLAFDPSKAHPDFEFTINNFSKVPGLDPTKGFWVQTYAGSPDDVVAGEDSINWIRIPTLEPQTVPEPATLAVWGLVVTGSAWTIKRKRVRSAQS